MRRACWLGRRRLLDPVRQFPSNGSQRIVSWGTLTRTRTRTASRSLSSFVTSGASWNDQTRQFLDDSSLDLTSSQDTLVVQAQELMHQLVSKPEENNDEEQPKAKQLLRRATTRRHIGLCILRPPV
jgi:hypothetical protein